MVFKSQIGFKAQELGGQWCKPWSGSEGPQCLRVEDGCLRSSREHIHLPAFFVLVKPSKDWMRHQHW